MNLLRSNTYTIKGHFHTGGIENAQCCANCERAIVEVVELADQTGNTYNVGVDCARTLVSSVFAVSTVDAMFQQAKTFSALLRKSRKLQPTGAIAVREYGVSTGFYLQGGFTVTFGEVGAKGAFFKNYPEELKTVIIPLCK